MRRRRRGLSTVVGATFFVIAAATIITYVSYSMDLLDTYAQNVITKQTTDLDRINEKFEITQVAIDNNKFNITVKNNGNVPLTLSRLWIEDLDVIDSTTRNQITETISPGQIKYNIGQSINYIASDSTPYELKLVSERGTNEEYFVNSVDQEPLYMQLSATPTLVPNGFTTTVTFQVVNNISTSNILLNLQPIIATSGSASAILESGPTPSSYESLAKGDVATFRWVYNISGDDDDSITFNATLANAIQGNFVQTTTKIKNPEFSEQSENAYSSDTAQISGVFGFNFLPSNILILHAETLGTPNGDYQMYSADSDGGNDGLRIELDQTNPSFSTAPTGDAVTIPAGNWVTSLRIQSEAMPASLKNDGEDMIFHFEDGDGVNPDNSEGISNRDLELCAATNTYSQSINTNNNDAEETVTGSGTGNMALTSTDLDMANEGSKQYLTGLRYTGINIPQGSTITSASIQFQADKSDSADLSLTIAGQAHDNAPIFTSNQYDISSRSFTTTVSWPNIPAWTQGEIGSDTTTPDLRAIVQEIVNRPGWSSGNSMAFIISGLDTDERVAVSYDGTGTTPTLTINWTGSGGSTGPDWQDNTGPHGSGSFYFDGTSSSCFRSLNDASDNDGNGIGDEPDTTALWFKTDGTVSSEQYLVYWSGDDGCTECNNYRIALDDVGKVLFEFETATDGGDVTTCKSTNEYDTDQWYHVVAVREGSGSSDECNLYISDINGNDAEPVINQNNNYGSNNVLTDGKWHVGLNKQENGKFFKGWMDDIIHWNDKALSASEADDLSKTNYGDGAHKIDLNFVRTDTNGGSIETIDSRTNIDVPFYDPKGLSDNDDSTFGVFNFTNNLGNVTMASTERLNLKINYVNSGSNWEALEADMKIDDQTMTPYSSFLQIPTPNTDFPGFFVYDPSSDTLTVSIVNAQEDGHWLSYYITRAVFKDTSDPSNSWAGVIDKVNSTKVDHMADSIFIPPSKTVSVDFFIPRNPPEPKSGLGGTIPPGQYNFNVYMQGYNDDGQMFLDTKFLGIATVQ